MPLFNNFELFDIPETGDVSLASLKTAVPSFFEEGSRGLVLGTPAHKWITVKRVMDKGHGIIPASPATYPPNPISIKARRSVTINGKQVWLQYSDQMPSVGTHKKSFPSGANKIELKEGFHVRADQVELLFFLYFACPFIKLESEAKNNKTLFYFRQPEIAAANKVSHWRKSNEISKLAFETLTMEQIDRAIKALHLPIELKSTEDQKRVAIESTLKGATPELYQAFLDVVNSEPDNTEVNMNEEVSRLLEEEKIKCNNGVWVSKSKTKLGEWNATPFYKSKSEKFEEAVLELVDHLKLNTALYKKINV